MNLQRVQRAGDRLADLNGFIAVVVFAGLTVVVALQVFTRFVLHAPFIWSEEVARFLFFWVALLGAAMSVRTRRHFVIDVTMGGAAGGSSRLGRLLLDIVPDVCVILFCGFLLFEGMGYTQTGEFRIGPNSRVNMAVVYAAIPTFAALSIIYSACNLVGDVAAFIARRGASRRPLQEAD